MPKAGFISAACAVALTAPISTRAGTGSADDQLWSELDLIVPLSSELTFTGIGQLRLSETLSNPTLTAAGGDLSYRNGDWTLAAGYRHQLTGNRVNERPNVTQVALLMATYGRQFGRSTVLIRLRFEDTITGSSDPFRARLRAEYRWKTENWGPVSYLFANNEGFYQFSNSEWFRNRAQAGMNLVLSARTNLRLYYQRQDSRNSTPRAINALGVLAAVTFR